MQNTLDAFLEQAREQLRLARRRAAIDAGFVRRVVHGIKGNAAVFGLTGLARMIDEIEAQAQIEEADVTAISDVLREFVKTHAASLGVSFERRSGPAISLAPEQLEQLRGVLKAHASEDASVARLLEEVETVPARELLGPVEELVERLSERFGKNVSFELVGADLRVDRVRFAPLAQAVPQLLRNAIDHGLELPEARGTKPERGRVRLELIETEASLVLAVQDDGRGIDREAVLRAAVLRGVVSEANVRMIPEADVLKLVLRERVSTAPTVTDISGRGYGLSGVAAETKRLGGEIVIHSRVGRGTRLELLLPKAPRSTRRPSQIPARSDTVQFRAPSQRGS